MHRSMRAECPMGAGGGDKEDSDWVGVKEGGRVVSTTVNPHLSRAVTRSEAATQAGRWSKRTHRKVGRRLHGPDQRACKVGAILGWGVGTRPESPAKRSKASAKAGVQPSVKDSTLPCHAAGDRVGMGRSTSMQKAWSLRLMQSCPKRATAAASRLEWLLCGGLEKASDEAGAPPLAWRK